MSVTNVTVHRAARYRINDKLLPEEGRTFLMQNFGCARKVYNLFVDDLYKRLEESGYRNGTIPKYEIPEVSLFKKAYPYLKEADSLGLANARLAFKDALSRFSRQEDTTRYTKRSMRRSESGVEPLSFRGLKGMPKFHSRAHGDFSYTTNCQYPSDTNSLRRPTIRLEENMLSLPKLAKPLPLVLHRPLPDGSVIGNVTVSMEANGELYASIEYTYEAEMDLTIRDIALCGDPKTIGSLRFLGLDYSQKDFYVDSEGRKANYPHYYRESEEKLAGMRRKLSRMEYNHETKKGSNNYNRQLKKIQNLECHIANQRRDFCQKESTRLVRDYDVVVGEDINLNAMGQSLSLGENLHDNGFGMFRDMLSYKLAYRGSCFVKVPKFYGSTKTCHICGHVENGIKLSDREWVCPECGTHHDRDVNAAINICSKGKEIFPEYYADVLAKQEKAQAKSEKYKAALKKPRTKKTA